jgi:hypothetical protein
MQAAAKLLFQKLGEKNVGKSLVLMPELLFSVDIIGRNKMMLCDF